MVQQDKLILIVDDIMQNISLIGSNLRTMGYRINVASSGKEAFVSIEQERPDLILLDINMPEMDGFEVCKRLKSSVKYSDIPIIFLTAETEADKIEKGFEVGAVDYITKPFRVKEVKARVKTHILLRSTQDELVRKNRLAILGQLTATVSHELRNPLGAMRPSLYIVRKLMSNEDSRLTQAVERIDRSITRCDHIIDELLDFTRIQNLEPRPTAIDDWLGGVLNELTVPQGISVVRKPGLPGLETMLDPDRLRRAVINVYDNACQVMLEDTAAGNSKALTLTVATRQQDGRIEIAFADTGPGIAADVLARIFEPLFSTKSFGVGLGLPTIKQIMEQHGGGIEVDSEVGHGTCMMLWLPVHPSPSINSATGSSA